jgi:hypothetical protein
MVTKEELKKIILCNYKEAKDVFDEIEERKEDLDDDFNEFCGDYAALYNKNFLNHLTLKHSYCRCLYLPEYGDCEFRCVTNSHGNYCRTLNCSRCRNEVECVYESTCIPQKTRRKQKFCMECLSSLHGINNDLINSQVNSHEMDEYDVREFYHTDFEKLMYSYEYETFDDFPLFSRLTQKLDADEEYFETLLKKRKRNSSVSLFEGENEFYEHDKIYVADFDVLSTLIFCLEKKGLSSFLIL